VIDGVLAQFRAVSLPIVVGLVAGVVVWRLLSLSALFQGLQQRVVLRLPVVGSLARATAMERYLAILGLMLRGGVPIAVAAEHGAHAAGHVVLTRRLLGIVPSLREGVPLSQALAAGRLLNPDALSLTATGDASGSLPEMLNLAASYYRRDNESKRRMLLRAAGVAIGLVWAVLVGFIFIKGVLTYFDFLFRAGDKLWMEG
jgi:type II secretory pathway component PulF